MRGLITVAAILAGVLCAFAEAESPEAAAQISPADRLKVFDKTWDTVNRKFFDPNFNGVDWLSVRVKYRPLAEAAEDKIQLQLVLDRMLRELGTSHTGIRGAAPFGMGFGSIQVGEQWLVRWVSPNSAAQRAGMQRGWIVLGLTGDCTRLENKISAQFLDLHEQKRAVDIPCGRYPDPIDTRNSTAPMLPDGAAYVRLADFVEGADKRLVKQLDVHRSASALVLDLRENWGGDVEVLRHCLDLFLADEAVIAQVRNRRGKVTTIKSGGKKARFTGRLFVIIDQKSGSSAEVFANVVQETGRGTIVGRRSLGGVLGGEVFALPHGFSVHVPTYDFTTAKGIRLEGRGVIPDEQVTVTIADFRGNHDADLDRVRELLNPVQ